MENISFVELEDSRGEKVQYAVIDKGNGEFTSMLKTTYDAQQEALANGNNL